MDQYEVLLAAKSALKEAFKLPHPWIRKDNPIPEKEWLAIFEKMDEAVLKIDAALSKPR